MSVSTDLDDLISSRTDLFGSSEGNSMVPIPSITGGAAGQSGATSNNRDVIFGDVNLGISIFTMLGAVLLAGLFIWKSGK